VEEQKRLETPQIQGLRHQHWGQRTTETPKSDCYLEMEIYSRVETIILATASGG
jgi:hypothetical protein